MKKFILLVLALFISTPCFACTRWWVGGGSSATWAATGNTNWGDASNTQDNASVPGASDDVCFDGVGTGASNSTVNAAISVKSIDFTGYSNTLTHATSTTVTVSGSVTMSATMTYSPASSTSLIAFNGGNGTLTSNGKTMGAISFTGSSSTYKLGSNVLTAQFTTLTSGTLDLNGFNLSTGFSSSNSNNRTLSGCGSTLTLFGSGTAWNVATSTNFLMSACPTGSPLTIAMTDTTASSKTFAGGGYGFYQNLSITGGGSGAVIFTGANTFQGINIGAPKTITFPASSTTTFTSLGCTGSSGNVITINSSSGGTKATLSQHYGPVSCDWLNLTDSATNWVPFYAGANSVNTSNNSGWIFSTPPTPTKISKVSSYYSN